MSLHSPTMWEPGLSNTSPLSPHRLFQELWKAIEAEDWIDVQRLADALIHMLQGNQLLARGAIQDLIGFAKRRQCRPEIEQTLTRLPGFEPTVKRS
jgi:hypothetical protein